MCDKITEIDFSVGVEQDFLSCMLKTNYLKQIFEFEMIRLSDLDIKKYKKANELLKKGIEIKLSDKIINEIFINFKVEQAFIILFGYWFGMSERKIKLFFKPEWSNKEFMSIFHILLWTDVPIKEVKEKIGDTFNKERFAELVDKYAKTNAIKYHLN